MKRTAITIALAVLLACLTLVSPTRQAAQTTNQNSKSQIQETFTFPNECTNELMDVSDTTTVTCHDQQRADGTFREKCEIRQDVTAVGRTSGIVWHGTATFKDELDVTDACNFSFSNRGKVNLISSGPNVNTIVTFDELVKKEDCGLTIDQHLVSFDCRGRS